MTGLPTTDRVWCIRDCRVGLGTIRSKLPHTDLEFSAGRARLHEREAVEAVRDIIERVAPWVTAYLGPQLWSNPKTDNADDYELMNKKRYGRINGAASYKDPVIYIRLSQSMPDVLATAYHELFHIIDLLLSKEQRKMVARDVIRGRDYPGGYYQEIMERRARAFEYFALSIEEGRRNIIRGTAEEVFEEIYCGAFAAQLAAA
ncbi:hypothetical protein T8K17_05105 [Thalassobaculum sp. OXR-137]|uniref:hypothetical protein n=1 Tax=Thalassobaculum sp. OXR-137 TaxID=3100173 RepID=UPI002AC9F113|nr:hypothetical protein [Thalassobaculum sp. OXR-137]WPZ35524.1 hypothetical protein T8K17_05105 [Thalassobaculum sp. OXR-137]